ncbi:PepSY domain-containing protein [Piscibacillus halophilus]|uniref:PepSY domain-containing protein n=1 Tax=Piscibacillus halophilus TaxID=571933 RepID=UPI00240A6CB9|nr:PepSY domain-containing protein [Piscibacillus halophilus]
MRRKIIVGALASSIAVGGTVGAVSYSDSLSSKTSDKEMDVKGDMESQVAVNTNKLIGVEELEDIVLSKVNGTIEEVELETKGEGKAFFEVEVIKDQKEYELIIDAYTGKIVNVEEKFDDDQTEKYSDRDEDDQDDDHRVDVDLQAESQTETSSKDVIGKEKAIKLALEVAQGKISEIDLDEDDGHYVYEIEVIGEQETEITIDAYTGKILEVEMD